MISFVIIILSFLLEVALSNIFYGDSLFINLFSILSLYVAYPFFKNQKRMYYITSLVLGFVYDLVLMPNFGINLIVFLFIAFLISIICDNFEETFFNNIVACLLIVSLYRFITYLIFILINNLSFNFSIWFESIYKSLIINYIYIILLYFFLRKRKYKL